jgi:polyisoprenoid-binding protein YceI
MLGAFSRLLGTASPQGARIAMTTQVDIPGYVAGSWVIDTVHSEVSFQARHLGVAKVRGTFDEFEGTITTAVDPLESTVRAVIRTASVCTKNKLRDTNLAAPELLDAERFPTMTFSSTGIRLDGDDFLVDGDLTIRDVTKPVTLSMELNGFATTPAGKPLAGFSAQTAINRHEFGVVGGPTAVVIGDTVKITLEIEAHHRD